jgi:hypothetical protein
MILQYSNSRSIATAAARRVIAPPQCKILSIHHKIGFRASKNREFGSNIWPSFTSSSKRDHSENELLCGDINSIS